MFLSSLRSGHSIYWMAENGFSSRCNRILKTPLLVQESRTSPLIHVPVAAKDL
jgi:hypothetical protein